MSFQLRRMLLVNAGTNKNRQSGRITQVDPRGGAAVIGANGVGKTSTLRLIPLFFGHPPSQVIALNEGQEGVRFILPSPTSAICFEYQRGSDAPENLRLVVMRARADADGPEYRIFPCEFRKEMFVQDNHFVTDEETVHAALERGHRPTKKLNTAEYRSVILGGRSLKGRDALAAYAREHSFGPRELPNLDKLVATMVKHGVKFADLVQVAVGLIELERGGDAGQRQRLVFRQQRKQLQDWLRNLQAAKVAIAAEPRVNALAGVCQDHISYEQEARHLHYLVLQALKDRELGKKAKDSQLQQLDAAREVTLAGESKVLGELQESAKDAGTKADRAKREYESARFEQKHFEDENAAHWSMRVREIPPLQAKRSGLAGQLAAALSSVQQVESNYRAEEKRISDDAQQRRAGLERDREPLHKAHDRERSSADDAQRTAITELGRHTAAARAELDAHLGPLRERAGTLAAQVQNPPAPAQELQALVDARQRRENHAGEMRRLGDRLQVAERTFGDRKKEFEAAERHAGAMRSQAAAAREDLRREQDLLHPADGTLLSALRAHPDEHWKATIARVVDPALLRRTDLDPAPVAEDDSHDDAYGWRLATGRIDAPAWSDDARQRQAVQEAQAQVDRAAHAEDDAARALATASSSLEEAEQALRKLDAEKSVLLGREATLREAIVDAEDALEAAQRQAGQAAQTELDQARAKIVELTTQITRLGEQESSRKAQIEREWKERVRVAEKRRDDGLAALIDSMEQLDADLAERVKQLHAQLAVHLRDQGIDPQTVQSLRDELDDHDSQIRDLASHQLLVDQWNEWVQAGGEQRVATLAGTAERAKTAAEDAGQAVERHRGAMRTTQSEHDTAASALRQQISTLETDISMLSALVPRFADYGPQAYEGVDVSPRASQIKASVHAKLQQLTESERSMQSEFLQLKKDLTAHESSTKDLIEGLLATAGQSVYSQSLALTGAWRRLGTQVIPDIRNTLQTVITNIGAFHRSILGFEHEVGAFNARLQEALKEVKRFERVDELHLDIVADFSTLPFYKDLRRVDEIVRDQQSSASLSRMELPPDIERTAEALSSFLGVIGPDGALEVNLAAHVSLRGSVIENGRYKLFRRAEELEGVSSEGLTTLILITLLVGLVNTVRRGDDVHVPWVSDEVGRFDSANFAALMQMLADNRIDVVTASPALDMTQFGYFRNRYVFEDSGVIKHFADPLRAAAPSLAGSEESTPMEAA
jgi:hypothetical protein